MKNEDILTWLTQLGTGWVGLSDIYYTFENKGAGEFWDAINEWHDQAYMTKRLNTNNMQVKDRDVEQYRLTKKALRQLEEYNTDLTMSAV